MAAAPTAETCSAASAAAGEPLAGTATRAERWLLVEVRGAWGRDVDETQLPEDALAAVDGFAGRVQMIRRPDRRSGEPAAFLAESRDDGGALRRLSSLEDLESGEPVDGPLVLVCCHGRRDACCARLGTPVFDALRAHLAGDGLWQSSHVGGHRFAANVLALPAGILLGRVSPPDVARVAAELAAGRIPLDRYRGRTIHTPEVQAADAAARVQLGLARIDDVELVSQAGGLVVLETRAGRVEATVERTDGPPISASCGAAPEAAPRYLVTRIER